MYQKQSRNANRSTDTIASFLLKTYQILEHPEYQRMICWDKSNVGFIIQDVVSFTRQILPKYFRHSNFSSFVRQLNMYDFHKVKQQNESLVFKNPLFCKGEQHNLKFIRRKAAKKIGGQRRQQSNEKNDLQNEKYQNLLKSFKKSIQSEINQSSLFYERSIQLLKDQNQSNQKKKDLIKDLSTIKVENAENQNNHQLKKDTIIRLPLQFLGSNYQEPKKQKYVKGLNSDALILLKQQCYKYFGIYQHWLNDYIEIQKKKIKYISNYKSQLLKCSQIKKQDNAQNEQNQPVQESQNMVNMNSSGQKIKIQDEAQKSILSNQNQVSKNQDNHQNIQQSDNEKNDRKDRQEIKSEDKANNERFLVINSFRESNNLFNGFASLDQNKQIVEQKSKIDQKPSNGFQRHVQSTLLKEENFEQQNRSYSNSDQRPIG